MSKYDFIQIGKKVIYDLLANGDYKIMQVCTSVPTIIKDDTKINIIATKDTFDECSCAEEEVEVHSVRADELKPYLEDFNKGYWCAVQDAVANGATETLIRDMLTSAGFSYDECLWHMEDSDFQNDKLIEIVNRLGPMTLGRLASSLEFEPRFLMLKFPNDSIVRGIIIDDRIDRQRDTLGRYIYDIRHSDDTLDLATLENHVIVNRECSIAVEKPIEELENGEYLEIIDWSYETWEEAAENALLETVKEASLEDIHEFISDFWENLETFEKNINTFKHWAGLVML